MARRKAKRRTNRRTKSINILGVAESALLASAVTQGLFNCNLYEWVSGNTDSPNPFGSDGASVMSLPELLGVGSGVAFGGNYGVGSGKTFGSQIKANFDNNWGTMATSLVVIPIGFRLAGKLTTKPRATANRMLRMAGIKEVKV